MCSVNIIISNNILSGKGETPSTESGKGETHPPKVESYDLNTILAFTSKKY